MESFAIAGAAMQGCVHHGSFAAGGNQVRPALMAFIS